MDAPKNGLLGQKLKCTAQATDVSNRKEGTSSIGSRSTTTSAALGQEEANNDSTVRFIFDFKTCAHIYKSRLNESTLIVTTLF